MTGTGVFSPPGADWLARGQAPIHAAWTGDVLQTSGIAGIDPKTGQLEPDPQRQFDLAFDNLRTILDQAGAGPDNVVLLNVFVPAREHRAHINAPWLRLFPGPDRPARKTNQAPLPEGLVVQLQATAIRGARARPLEIPGLGHRDPLPMGCTAGGLVMSSVIGGEDPATNLAPTDPKAQIEQAFDNVRRLMEQAGGGLDNVNHLWVFLRDFDHAPAMLEAYLAAFPIDGDRPARKSLPYPLPEGAHVQIQVTGMTAGRRVNYELPGVAHHDPIPLASRIGPLLQSSGLHGLDPATGRMVRGGAEAETDMVLGTMARLMESAGGGLDDILSLTVMVRDFSLAQGVNARLERLFGEGARVPPLQFVQYELPPDLNVQFHLSAVLGPSIRTPAPGPRTPGRSAT